MQSRSRVLCSSGSRCLSPVRTSVNLGDSHDYTAPSPAQSVQRARGARDGHILPPSKRKRPIPGCWSPSIPIVFAESSRSPRDFTWNRCSDIVFADTNAKRSYSSASPNTKRSSEQRPAAYRPSPRTRTALGDPSDPAGWVFKRPAAPPARPDVQIKSSSPAAASSSIPSDVPLRNADRQALESAEKRHMEEVARLQASLKKTEQDYRRRLEDVKSELARHTKAINNVKEKDLIIRELRNHVEELEAERPQLLAQGAKTKEGALAEEVARSKTAADAARQQATLEWYHLERTRAGLEKQNADQALVEIRERQERAEERRHYDAFKAIFSDQCMPMVAAFSYQYSVGAALDRRIARYWSTSARAFEGFVQQFRKSRSNLFSSTVTDIEDFLSSQAAAAQADASNRASTSGDLRLAYANLSYISHAARSLTRVVRFDMASTRRPALESLSQVVRLYFRHQLVTPVTDYEQLFQGARELRFQHQKLEIPMSLLRTRQTASLVAYDRGGFIKAINIRARNEARAQVMLWMISSNKHAISTSEAWLRSLYDREAVARRDLEKAMADLHRSGVKTRDFEVQAPRRLFLQAYGEALILWLQQCENMGRFDASMKRNTEAWLEGELSKITSFLGKMDRELVPIVSSSISEYHRLTESTTEGRQIVLSNMKADAQKISRVDSQHRASMAGSRRAPRIRAPSRRQHAGSRSIFTVKDTRSTTAITAQRSKKLRLRKLRRAAERTARANATTEEAELPALGVDKSAPDGSSTGPAVERQSFTIRKSSSSRPRIYAADQSAAVFGTTAGTSRAFSTSTALSRSAWEARKRMYHPLVEAEHSSYGEQMPLDLTSADAAISQREHTLSKFAATTSSGSLTQPPTGQGDAEQAEKPSPEPEDALQKLDYQIPPDEFRAALMASPDSGMSYWKQSLYRSTSGDKTTIHYCTKLDAAERVARMFANERVLGFDIEWELTARVGISSIKDNVSLIQIASESRIALFQLATFQGEAIEDLMPQSLKEILESPEIIKAGVNIGPDFTRLRRCLDVQGQGVFELSHLYKVVKFSEDAPEKVNKIPYNLAAQVQNVLNLPLAKGAVRTSAWSKRLSAEQIEYAASDAYAGFRLFHALEAKRRAMNPRPPRPAYHELGKPLILADGRTAPVKRAAVVVVAEDDGEDVDSAEDPSQSSAADETYDDADSSMAGYGQSTVNKELYDKADQWANQQREAGAPDKKQRAGIASLRAYALWQHEDQSLEQIAKILRDRPLRVTSVASYVLDAVQLDDLPYETEKLRQALQVVSRMALPRYWQLSNKIKR